ncbi:MAG: helix-turn-helix domain-containing protein [Gammaproteobacteria bacterium]|nr:helix-turn-helix domain-containing protein [Gammaproteobacteria bacterium]
MLSLDILFENLDITVHPFVLCCAENGVSLSLGPRDEATIHYVLGGTGTLMFEGYPPFDVEAGTMIIAPAGALHELRGTGQSGQIPEVLNNCQPLNVGLEVMGANIQDLNDGIAVVCGSVDAVYRGIDGIFDYLPEPIMVQSNQGDIIRHSFELIIREMTQVRSGSRAMLRLLFQECLIEMLRRYGESENCSLEWLNALNKPRLGKVVQEIIENPGHPHSLETLADLSMMSRSTFAARFKECFGRSPMEFVKEMRLRSAARLLIQTDIPIKSIGSNVGYDSRSHFSGAFTEFFKTTPGEYRKTQGTEA